MDSFRNWLRGWLADPFFAMFTISVIMLVLSIWLNIALLLFGS